MVIYTDSEVQEVEKEVDGKVKVIAVNRETNEKIEVKTDELLVAAGRSSNSDILHPEKSGIKTDKDGWIMVNELLETSKKNIYAFGDANGKYLFKHAANYESKIVYYNAIQNQELKVAYHAIPRAVFSDPEVASVGMREAEAIDEFGKEDVIIGFQRYQDTAKGVAMDLKDFFVKVIVHRKTMEILGAHIIGPFASVLIQEIINLMYTPERSIVPIFQGMHIHPALNEVVERAAGNLMPVDHYHHFIQQIGL
jgi:dihydrolipoamide dehydrogenase